MSALDEFKLNTLRQLSNVGSFKQAWGSWQGTIESRLHGHDWGSRAFNLGDHLSEIFQTTGSPGRSQSTVSASGASWECFVQWYLNLIFWGTPVVAVRQNRSFVPPCISDCLTVTISNNPTNSESDLLVFSVPDAHLLAGSSLSDLNVHLESRLRSVNLSVVQCKTNWNDNSQIPMLWDMIYNAHSRLSNVSIGINGFSPIGLGSFSYGFMTVPTNKPENIKRSSLCVLRVKDLTGGNYWGRPTASGIASSIKEFPGRNFSSFFEGSVIGHLSALHSSCRPMTEKFISLNFE